MIILDTCVLLWLVGDQGEISKSATRAIKSNAGSIYVSSISALEIGIKVRRKKLVLPTAVDDWYGRVLELHGIGDLPMNWQIASEAATLPMIHSDPFDRIILATAKLCGAALVGPDKHMAKYSEVETIW